MLTGTYQMRADISRRLLDALPEVLVLAVDSWDSPLVGYLARGDRPGRAGAGGGP